MNKLSFTEKNDLVVKHKGLKHFSKDLELFQKHVPSNPLNNDLARANEFSFERLDGQMLYILLDKVLIEDILKNREEKPVEEFVSIETQPEDETKTENPPVDPVPPTEPVPPVDPVPPTEPVPPVNPAEEKLKELAKRIDELEENVGVNESDIDYLRDELNNKDASIEALETKIAELEARPTAKKKD